MVRELYFFEVALIEEVSNYLNNLRMYSSVLKCTCPPKNSVILPEIKSSYSMGFFSPYLGGNANGANVGWVPRPEMHL